MASKGTIGAKIALEGESAYRQALKNINSEQKQLRSEMKLCTSTFSDQQNSLTALTNKSQILAKQYEVQQQKVKVYAEAVENSAKKQKEAADKIEALQTALDKAKTSMSDMEKSSDVTAEAMEEQKKTVAELEDQLALANSDYDKATQQTNKYKTSLNYAEAELNDLSDELQTNSKYLTEAETSMDGTAKSIDEYGKEVEDAGEKTAGFGTILSANLSTAAIISGIKALAEAIKEVTTACVETGMQFEASMSKVKALSGATETDFARLTDKAKEMGATTMFSASQAADAFSYMALAGWNAEEMLEGIEPVLSLAAAADMDLAEASDIVTDYLTAFGLSAADAAEFSDQLAYAMSNSNTNVEQLGEAYKNCAATANSLGYSVEDVTAVLMSMANAGVKGGEAGTGLSTIMTRLATNTKNCGDILMQYGVEVYDAQGNMNSLSDILEGLEHIWANLSDQEQAALAKAIAGTNQYSKLQTIMNGVSEETQKGGKSFYDYAKALENVDGAAKDMANTMQDNLKGKLTILQSAMDALKTSAYETFDETLKASVDDATSAVGRLNDSVANGDLHTSLTNLSDSLGNFLSDAVDVAEDALPALIDGFTWFLNNLDLVASDVTGVMAAMLTSKTIIPLITSLKASWVAYSSAVEGATVKQWLLNAAMNANVVAALATALVGLTAATVTYYALNKDELSTLSETDKRYRDLCESAEELNKQYKNNSETRKQNREDIENESKVTDDLLNRLEELNSAEKLSADQKAEVTSIVSQLNSKYSDLAITIDETTGKTNESTDAIRAEVEEIKKLAYAAAVEEDLKNASSDLYDAQKHLKELEEEHAEAEARVEEATKNLTEAQENASAAFIGSGGLTEYNIALENAKDSEQALREEMDSTRETVTSLDDEVNSLSEELASSQPVVDTTTESIEALASAESDAKANAEGWSTSTRESWSNLEETTVKSVEGQLNAFEKFNSGSKISTETLKTNLQSQIDGVTGWSTNMQTLAERGVSEGLLTELAKMGPEGSNYVQAFVNMTDEELADYDQKFADYVKIGDSVSSEIADAYAETAEQAVAGFTQGIEDNSDEAEKAAEDMGDFTVKALKDNLMIHSPSKVTEEIGQYFDEGLQTGIEQNKNNVISTVKSLCSEVVSITQTELASSKFYSIGIEVDNGLASGITNGKSSVVNAAIEVARAGIKAAKDELGVASPSKKFKYIGEMMGLGLKNGWTEEMSDISNVISSSMPDTNVVASTFDASKFNSANAQTENVSLNADEIYSAVRDGAADANITLSIGSKEFGRLLKGMGVKFS